MYSNSSDYLNLCGFRVHYQCLGTGSRLIVLLHGSFLNLHSWRLVMPELAHEATVVAIDRPTCGSTSRPLPKDHNDSLYSAENQSDLVAALIETLGFTEAILIGHSTGGTIALLTALRHPQRVRGLVLVGAMVYSGYATSEIPKIIKFIFNALRPLFTGLMGFLISKLYDLALRKLWYQPDLLARQTLDDYRTAFMQESWKQAFFALFLATHRLNLEIQLSKITIPVLVITGEHDRAVKSFESERLARELPNAQYLMIPNCGHLPHEETPTIFLNSVLTFGKAMSLFP